MTPNSKDCPDCGNPMRLCGVKSPAQGAGLSAGAEIIQCIGVMVLPVVVWALCITGVTLVTTSVLIVVVAVLWKPRAIARRANEEQSGLYCCGACGSYFEGSRLRRITEAEAKRGTDD
jgi:hypothetical protein